MAPTIGRIVHYIGSDTVNPVHAPAMIVKVWDKGPSGCCNLVVFKDGGNDKVFNVAPEALSFWATSVVRSDDDQAKGHTWHLAQDCKTGH